MSKIQWTNETWNPIIGCEKISEGCKECYAEKMAIRLASMEDNLSALNYREVMNGSEYEKPTNWNGKTYFVQQALLKPFKWKKPRMIFVCSMSDLFHKDNSFADILRIWDVMCQLPQHTFQVLTKRPERMLEFYKWMGDRVKADGFDSIPSGSDNSLDYIGTPDHIWIGVTVENQKRADERIPVLLEIPAKVKFLSCEPLLSDILFPWFDGWLPSYNNPDNSGCEQPAEPMLNCLDWVIAGPETGPGKRPMKKEWLANIYTQCISANVPFFDKKDTLGLNIKEFPE